jgi:NAD(P)-dependent dehydrogenase (short-subunit alcohol dehydrogenase family)
MPTALVTGAGRGLGREIARRLAERGYAVHVTDVDAGAAAQTAELLGGRAWSSVLDVSDAAACRAAAAATAERGGLDVWVNNAGVIFTGAAWENDDAQREAMLDVNLRGTVNGTLAALDHMRPADSGHVLNVVSLAGLAPVPGETFYAATKHACLAFSVGTLFDLRRRGCQGVWVSALCPDGIWTPMLHDKVDDPDAALSWSGILLRPEQVAEAAMAVLDEPRPVRAVPRWRGALVRTIASFPGPALRLLPLLLRDARRRQRAWARRHVR